MDIQRQESRNVTACERRLLEVLREKGPQTLDNLCALPDFGWAPVLMAVDHLTRTHEVMLEMIGPREYQVSLVGGRA